MRVHQHLEVSNSQRVALVRLLDRQLVEGIDIQGLGHELLRLIESESRSKLVLDFSLVNLLTGAALGILIALHKNVVARKGMMKLCCMRPEVYEIFAVTKLDRLFDIEDTEASAVAAFE
jgi:anti-sigma B factor antagonist